MLIATHTQKKEEEGHNWGKYFISLFHNSEHVDNVSPYICSKSDYIKSLSSHTGLTRFQAPRILVGEASLGSLQNN